MQNARPAGLLLAISIPLLAAPAMASDGAGVLAPRRALSALDGLLQQPAAGARASVGLAQDAGGPEKIGGMNPRVRSMLLSLLVPGLGQYVAGDRTWSFVFFGAEAAIWTTYAGFQIQGNLREDRFEEYANLWGGVAEPSGHASSYYSDLGSFMTYEDYRVVAIRSGEGELYPEEQRWAWPSDERRVRFLDLRAASEDSFQRAEFMIAAALLNRAISVVHAARSVSASPKLSFRIVPDVLGAPMTTVAFHTRF